MDKVYGLVKGNENDTPDFGSLELFTDFDDALNIARCLNKDNLFRLHPEKEAEWEANAELTVEQSYRVNELWTAGLVNPEARKIAEAYMAHKGHWVDETCVNELIDNVINKCFKSGYLPWGWYGVVEYRVNGVVEYRVN